MTLYSGNLNRQFVSLLRSEQDAERPITGNPDTFEILLGGEEVPPPPGYHPRHLVVFTIFTHQFMAIQT